MDGEPGCSEPRIRADPAPAPWRPQIPFLNDRSSEDVRPYMAYLVGIFLNVSTIVVCRESTYQSVRDSKNSDHHKDSNDDQQYSQGHGS